MFSKISLFFKESRQEFKKVNWPSREATIRYTMFVIGFSLSLALFLGLLDFIFVQVIERGLLKV